MIKLPSEMGEEWRGEGRLRIVQQYSTRDCPQFRPQLRLNNQHGWSEIVNSLLSLISSCMCVTTTKMFVPASIYFHPAAACVVK